MTSNFRFSPIHPTRNPIAAETEKIDKEMRTRVSYHKLTNRIQLQSKTDEDRRLCDEERSYRLEQPRVEAKDSSQSHKVIGKTNYKRFSYENEDKKINKNLHMTS